MDNSIKFSKPKSTIRIAMLEETETRLKIQWEDSGIGMSRETREKLLSDSPELTKKEHEKEIGSGLGMRLCISMLEKNGGALDIWSEKGVGTKIIITLPKINVNGTD
jgi:K+-sensing histidine kinase KdpD